MGALKQDYFGQKIRALDVLFDRASTTPSGEASETDGESAIYGYLQVLNQIEDLPPDRKVPYTMAFSGPGTQTVTYVVALAYNYAAFRASEGIGSTGMYLRIEPSARHAQWLPEWQRDLDLLQDTWRKRMDALEPRSVM